MHPWSKLCSFTTSPTASLPVRIQARARGCLISSPSSLVPSLSLILSTLVSPLSPPPPPSLHSPFLRSRESHSISISLFSHFSSIHIRSLSIISFFLALSLSLSLPNALRSRSRLRLQKSSFLEAPPTSKVLKGRLSALFFCWLVARRAQLKGAWHSGDRAKRRHSF